MPGSLNGATEEDDLDVLSKPTLTRRKDFIDKEEEARKSPNRVLYFRRNADYDRLIEACSRKLRDNPRNIRALLIRASSYLKKGERALTRCVQLTLAKLGGKPNKVWCCKGVPVLGRQSLPCTQCTMQNHLLGLYQQVDVAIICCQRLGVQHSKLDAVHTSRS